MFKKFLLLLLLSFLCLKGFTQEKTARQLAVEKVLVDVFDGLSARDMGKMRANCTTDFLLLENGLVWNLDTLQAKLAVAVEKNYKRENSFEFFNTVVKNKIAWINYRNKAVVTNGEKVTETHWMESAILEKYKGVWKLKVAQSTLVTITSK